MIWYFIAGWIAGAVGMLLLGKYLSDKIEKRMADDEGRDD